MKTKLSKDGLCEKEFATASNLDNKAIKPDDIINNKTCPINFTNALTKDHCVLIFVFFVNYRPF